MKWMQGWDAVQAKLTFLLPERLTRGNLIPVTRLHVGSADITSHYCSHKSLSPSRPSWNLYVTLSHVLHTHVDKRQHQVSMKKQTMKQTSQEAHDEYTGGSEAQFQPIPHFLLFLLLPSLFPQCLSSAYSVPGIVLGMRDLPVQK